MKTTKTFKPRKRALRIGPKTWFRTSGGPLAGVLLTTSGTLTFRLNGERGFYDNAMVWQAV